jgi:hypothetical protein
MKFYDLSAACSWAPFCKSSSQRCGFGFHYFGFCVCHAFVRFAYLVTVFAKKTVTLAATKALPLRFRFSGRFQEYQLPSPAIWRFIFAPPIVWMVDYLILIDKVGASERR